MIWCRKKNKDSVKKNSDLLFIDYERGVIVLGNVFMAWVSGTLPEIGNIGGGRGRIGLEEKVINSVLDVSSFLLK